VEPRGLEPLTPCLQSEGMAIAQCRWGALSVAEPRRTALSSGDIAVLCCCTCSLRVETHHLLAGLLAEGVATAILERLGLTAEAIRDSGRHLLGPPWPATNQVPPMSAEA
jgi:Clp amino terminal domain, pathogenicity island component